MRYALLLVIAAALLAAPAPVETFSYWVEPCPEGLSRRAGCEAPDAELAEWALQSWQKAAGGSLAFVKAGDENSARIRIYWAWGRSGLYGEARPISVDGKPGAAVYVRPDVSQLGPEIEAIGIKDRLFRHAVVYLTCLHESGHAIGLSHTAAFDDIMYSFQFGGDILEYFSRYRRRLSNREDIRRNSGMSAADEKRLATLYAK